VLPIFFFTFVGEKREGPDQFSLSQVFVIILRVEEMKRRRDEETDGVSTAEIALIVVVAVGITDGFDFVHVGIAGPSSWYS